MEDSRTVPGDEVPTSAKEGVSINPAASEPLQQRRLQRQSGTGGQGFHTVLNG